MNLARVAGAIQAMPHQRTSVPTECEQYHENDSDSGGVDGVCPHCDCIPRNAHAGGPPNPAPSPSPSPAPAQNYQFQNAAGHVSCNLSSGGAACEISNRTYTISTPPPPCAQHSAWGDRFLLGPGGVTIDCHNDTLHVRGEQVLNDGQTLSSGTFSCTSEPSAMRCTDSASGHFFYMSPGSYQIG